MDRLIGVRSTLNNCTQETLPKLNVAQQLIVVDSSLPALEQLLQGLAPQQQVLKVRPDEDAIAAITDQLATLAQSKTAVESLVILAHGRPGEVLIGKESINVRQLTNRAQDIQRWNVQDIQLFSCHTGAAHHFTETLEQLSGATVFASEQTVGYERLGGSWLLKSVKGIVSTVPFSAFSRSQWPFTLVPLEVTAANRSQLPPLTGNFDSYALTIPDGTTAIPLEAFPFIPISSLVIPDSVISIGDSAFFATPLTSLDLGNGVTSIGINAFRKTQLTSLTFPDSVTSIGGSSFTQTPLASINLPPNLTSIGIAAFDLTQLTSVVIPNGITSISAQAFARSPITSVTIPDSVTEIGASAFQETRLTSVEIPNSVTSIGLQAFFSTPISSTIINDYVSLGPFAFSSSTTVIRRDPTLAATIALADDTLAGGDSTTVTITFTEAVTNFTANDLVVENGTITDLTPANGGVSFTAALVANNVADATNRITLAADAYTDLAGNIGGSNTTSANFITELNKPPIGAPTGTINAAEDTATTITTADLLAGFSDAEGQTLTVDNISADQGTLSDNGDGTFTFTPDANFNGTVALTYDVTDGFNTLADQTLRFGVTPVNDAPVGITDSYSTDEDTVLSVPVAQSILNNDSDVDGDGLVASLATDAANGSVTLNADGSFDYTPDANFSGTDSFTYTVSDGGLTSNPVTVNIAVGSANDAPVAGEDSFTATEDTVLSVPVAQSILNNDSDVDGDGLVASLATDAANGSVTLDADGSFDYTPDANFNGSDSFTYEVSDGSFTDSATVTIGVNSVNDAPTGTADSYRTNAGETLSILAGQGVLTNDSDVDGDALSAVFDTEATSGSVTLNGDGSFDYVPNASFSGSDSFTYRVNDGTTTSDAVTVNLTVESTNAAPTIIGPAHVTAHENQTSAIDVDTIDDVNSEGNGLTYSLTGHADDGLFDINAHSGVVSFKTAPDFEEPRDHGRDNVYDIQVTATDGDGLTDVQDIAITVKDVLENAAPVITSPDHITVHENQTFAIDVDAIDDVNSEGNGLSYSLTGHTDDNLFDINAHTGVVSLKTAPDFEQPTDHSRNNVYDIQVTATDADGLSDVQNIAITVADVAESSGVMPQTLYGTDANETLVGGDGSDRISSNGGHDILIGNGGHDTIWGGSQVDQIWGSDGDDTIFSNGGQDFIDSGSGFDQIWLGGQSDATVLLSEGEGYDWIANFQMGMTSLKGFHESELDIIDSAEGARIAKGSDLLAIVPWKTKAMLKGAFMG